MPRITGPMPPDPAEPVLANPALYRSVVWRRVVAYLLDLCLIALLGVLAWVVLGLLWVLSLGLLGPLLWPLSLLVPLAYHTLAVASPLSATPGQVVMGLLVRSEPEGGRPSPLQALAATLLLYLTLATSGLLLLAALFSNRGRTLHDVFSATVVVRAAAMPGRRTRGRIGG